MKLTILIAIVTILLTVYLFVRSNIKNNIDGYLDSINFNSFVVSDKVTVNSDIIFTVVNLSRFSPTINKLNVQVYNDDTNKLIGSSDIKNNIKIKKGINEYSIQMKNINVLENVNDYLSGNKRLLVIISFKVLGIKVSFDEIVTF